MPSKFNTISSKTLFKNPYWDYKYDEYVLPNYGRGEYYYVETPGSVMVIPITNDCKFVFTKQYRYLNKRISYEFPGGGIKVNFSDFNCAKMELQEESGYKSDKITKIGVFNPFNGVTNEICNVFIAEDLTKVGSNPDASEEFDVVALSESEILYLISNNEIWDGMTLSAWSLYYFSKNRS